MTYGRLFATGLLSALAAVLTPAAASAETFTVTGTDDGGVCTGTSCPSIRAALRSARDGDAIVVGAGVHRLTLGQLTVSRSVSIIGAGADRTTVAGALEGGFRVFEIGGDVSAQPAVTIEGLTMERGEAPCSGGGNLRNFGTLRLRRVRVTDGAAGTGGGIANYGSLVLERSLVDANRAWGCDGSGGSGGGVYTEAAVSDALVAHDSTVASNAAPSGGGIVAVDVSQTDPRPLGVRLERVTLARNHAFSGAGGLLTYPGTRVAVGGSILAENTVDPPASAVAAPRPSNCGGHALHDGGGNLVDHADCGFAGLPADPRLGAPAAGAGGTAVLAIPPDSPAVDRAGVCDGDDQRLLPRPQGGACDAGAYEVAVAPVIESGPSGSTEEGAPVFVFAGAPVYECRLDGPVGVGAWEPCVSPKRYSALATGGYVFRVRGAGGGAETSRAFTVTAPPAPPNVVPAAPSQTPIPTVTPTPEYRRSIVARPTSGTITVRLPGTRRYVPLAAVGTLPLGASIDARKGRVRLYAARGTNGPVQAATFYGGVFRVRQRGRFVDLLLQGPKPTCGSSHAGASASKKKRKRRLWGSGKGSFRTTGRYSAATVRGTKWLVEDRCRSTLTRVTRGVVTVRDFKRKRTVRLRAGDRYVARRR